MFGDSSPWIRFSANAPEVFEDLWVGGASREANTGLEFEQRGALLQLLFERQPREGDVDFDAGVGLEQDNAVPQRKLSRIGDAGRQQFQECVEGLILSAEAAKQREIEITGRPRIRPPLDGDSSNETKRKLKRFEVRFELGS